MSAVQGNIYKFSTLSDGSIRVVIDLDEVQGQVFLETFGQINIPVALARLNVEATESGEE